MMPVHVCRCCLSQDCYKDISSEYFHVGQKEVYSDMLFDTFGLIILYEEDSKRLICEDCILKLRSAVEFRKQVVCAEETIVKKMLDRGVDIDSNAILPKLETGENSANDDFIDHITVDFDDRISDEHCDQNCHYDDNFSWRNDGIMNKNNKGELFVIKLNKRTEPISFLEEEMCRIDSKKKSKKSRRKLSESHTLGFDDNTEIALPVLTKETGNTSKRKALKTDKDVPPLNKESKSKRKRPATQISQAQIDMKQNSLKLINNSNLCLFDSLKTKFRCFYCKESFMRITELREHSISHSNQRYLKMCINRLQGMSYKNVDISNLACKICSEQLKDLKDLQTHLTDRHKIEFSNGDHLLIPYKLENDFQCIVCDEKFNTYYRLSVHMNCHFSNNVCEICGTSYINRMSLRMHVSQMHREKKCSICATTFRTTYNKIKHMRKEHNFSSSKRYCLLCNKTFQYTYLLTEHKVREHGEKRLMCTCLECGKIFLTEQNLRIHTRSVHIKERNHPCSYCGMRFFTKCDQKRHETTHQDVRSFSCEFCEGRFKAKDSLRRHLKRQHAGLLVADSERGRAAPPPTL